MGIGNSQVKPAWLTKMVTGAAHLSVIPSVRTYQLHNEMNTLKCTLFKKNTKFKKEIMSIHIKINIRFKIILQSNDNRSTDHL